MNHTIPCLQTEAIESLLAGQLTPEELTTTEEHLTRCGTCRQRIERTIGSPEWWQEACQALASGDRVGLDDGGSRKTIQPGSSADRLLAVLGPSDDPRMLGRIGSYEVVGLIGRGGMGVVFKGFDAALNRYVAIKMLLPHLATSGAARKRFAREAQAAAAVVDDHVMPIHYVADWQGVPYFVMPYTRGLSLQKRLDQEGPLELREILRIGLQTARGLAAAHAQGLVHRDIKPANILLDEGVERVALVDFGLARAVDDASLTHSGMLAGTPQYMSPEQARGETVDQRSDLFSLGSVLHAMCTGNAPFRAETSYGVLRRITDAEPRPIREINADIPEWLCRLIARLMSKEPADRPESAREVARLLEECLAHVQRPTEAALPGELVEPSASLSVSGRRTRKGVFTMTSFTVFLLLSALMWQRTAAPDISGQWTGEEWSSIVLAPLDDEPDWYTGRYESAEGDDAGTFQLSWSPLQRRFNGQWKLSGRRYGDISIRMTESGEIRGALTVDAVVEETAAVPRLRDFIWTRKQQGESQPPEEGSAEDVAPSPDVHRLLKAKQQQWEAALARFREGNASADEMIHAAKELAQAEHIANLARTDSVGLVEGSDVLPKAIRGRIAELGLVHRTTEPLRDERTVAAAKKLVRQGEARLLKLTRPVGPVGNDFDYLLVKWPRSGPITYAYYRSPERPMEAQNHRHMEADFEIVGTFTTELDVRIVAASADGNYIAIGNGNPTRVLQTDGTSRVRGDWTPEVQVINTESRERISVRMVTSEDDERLLEAMGRTHREVTALALSADGKSLAVGTDLGEIRLFRPSTGEHVSLLEDPKGIATGEPIPDEVQRFKRALGSVAALAFSPDGSLLAACGESFDDQPLISDKVRRLTRPVTRPGRVKVWDVATGSLKHDLGGHSLANDVAFSPDGELLASAGRWQSAHGSGTGAILWSTQAGDKLRTIEIDANGGTRAVAFSPDSKFVAMGSQQFDKTDDTSSGIVTVAFASSGLIQWQHQVPGWAKPVAVLPNAKFVAMLCCDGSTMSFLDLETGSRVRDLRVSQASDGGRWYDFAMLGDTLVTGGTNQQGHVELWTLRRAPDAGSENASRNEAVPTATESRRRGSEQPIPSEKASVDEPAPTASDLHEPSTKSLAASGKRRELKDHPGGLEGSSGDAVEGTSFGGVSSSSLQDKGRRSDGLASSADVAAAEAELSEAERQFNHMETMVEKGYQKQPDIEAARSLVEAAQAKLGNAPREYEAQETLLQLDVESAKLKVNAARAAAVLVLPAGPMDDEAEFRRIAAAERNVMIKFISAQTSFDRGEINDSEFAEIVERNVLPPYAELRSDLERLAEIPDADTEFLRQIGDHVARQQDCFVLLLEALREQDADKLRRYESQMAEAQAFARRMVEQSRSR